MTETTDALLNLGGLYGPLHAAGSSLELPTSRPEADELRSLTVALRIRPVSESASHFSVLLEELEERFLARQNSAGSDGDIRTVVLSYWSDKRPLLDATLAKHGYGVKDLTTLASN